MRIKAYPVEAKAGLLWAYLGPAPAPLVPTWEPFTWGNGFVQVVMTEIPCNWFQCQENSIDPVHFGVVAVVNIMIGLITPPYGLLLFLMMKIADVSLKALVREVMPFLVVMIGALALITFVPDLVLFLPRAMGYKG